ncbi:hypothetical protein LTS18_006774 [Coniosporium uncinatum]|uniref:Uncharacterized protein n=1 Tax=Coniosporium uncinatum TaxID=93489 RepID=A0ACC3D3E6_9PEZI|nr:hypothetical protein LTS18_006774 [Coniosporium uncinatum]
MTDDFLNHPPSTPRTMTALASSSSAGLPGGGGQHHHLHQHRGGGADNSMLADPVQQNGNQVFCQSSTFTNGDVQFVTDDTVLAGMGHMNMMGNMFPGMTPGMTARWMQAGFAGPFDAEGHWGEVGMMWGAGGADAGGGGGGMQGGMGGGGGMNGVGGLPPPPPPPVQVEQSPHGRGMTG